MQRCETRGQMQTYANETLFATGASRAWWNRETSRADEALRQEKRRNGWL